MITMIPLDAFSKLVLRYEFHELCEHHFSGVHATSPDWLSTRRSMAVSPESVEIVETRKYVIC
jgi:hypothetical protein